MMAFHKNANSRRDAGFSLLEVLIAVMILTVGILAIIPMLAFSIKSNSLGKDYAYANFLAQQRLEQVYAWPIYEDAPLYDPNNPQIYRGINSNNNMIVGSELVYDDRGRAFTRTTEVLRNGYLGASGNVIWSTASFTDEGGISDPADPTHPEMNSWNPIAGASLNTGANVGEYDASGSAFRGEDFKIVRVRVSWYDSLGPGPQSLGSHGVGGRGGHEIERHMFVANY